ncbi:MAG: hypothetical protein WBP81_38695 [Solirubrobacteraceae bacterium]
MLASVERVAGLVADPPVEVRTVQEMRRIGEYEVREMLETRFGISTVLRAAQRTATLLRPAKDQWAGIMPERSHLVHTISVALGQRA